MGQKVHPIGFRLAIDKNWRSKWYASERDYADILHSDLAIRDHLKSKLAYAFVSDIIVERAWNSLRVTIFTARPGLVIGRKGSEIERMTQEVAEISGNTSVKVDIMEVKQPELNGQLVAENVAMQLQRRISFRRAMKKAVQSSMDFGAQGIRLRCAGRLGGADIARVEWYKEGKVPLQTLRAPISFGQAEAKTTYGIIGVKCWITPPQKEKKRK